MFYIILQKLPSHHGEISVMVKTKHTFHPKKVKYIDQNFKTATRHILKYLRMYKGCYVSS